MNGVWIAVGGIVTGFLLLFSAGAWVLWRTKDEPMQVIICVLCHASFSKDRDAFRHAQLVHKIFVDQP